MNFLKNLKYYSCVLLACCVIACDSKNDNDSDGDYSNSPLAPDEHKAKLETIGKDFVTKIKAEDHKAVVNSLQNLADLISNSNFDELLPRFSSKDESSVPHQLLKVIQHNDANALMRLATRATDDDKISISDFEGIYTYNVQKKEWTKTPATNKMELNYTVNNVVSLLSISLSDIKQYTKIKGTIIDIPGKTEMTLTVDKQKVMTFTATINLSSDMLSVDFNSKLSLSNDYTWEIVGAAKSDKAATMFKMTVKGEELINGTVEVGGNKLTDPEYIKENEVNILNTGKFDFTVMDIRLSGHGNIKSIQEGLNKIVRTDPWDSDYSEAADKKAAEAEMKLYNDHMKIEGFYQKDKQKFADIKMGLDSYVFNKNYWEEGSSKPTYTEMIDWEIQPILVFADKSEVEFEDFFTESRFSSLISSVETLINSYMKLMGKEKVEL